MSRMILTANTPFYISTTGNDSNDGLTPSTPKRTRQAIWNWMVSSLDCAGFQPVIQFAAGTYTDEFAAVGSPIGIVSRPLFKGDPANWWNVFFDTQGPSFWAFERAFFDVQCVRLRSANADCIFSEQYSKINFGSIAFDSAVNGAHINGSKHGEVFTDGSYDVWGDAQHHVVATNFGAPFLSSVTCNLYGGRAFSAFAKADVHGQVGSHDMVFNGGVTGKRYEGTRCSGVGGLTGSPTYWPGSSAGTVDSTSYYI